MRPVDALVGGANAISATRLDVRLPVANPEDEVGQIAQAFNATLAKLEASFEQLRRFTANASHELRTPLTALRTTGQAVLTGGQSVDAYREAVADMLEDAEHLSRVLDAMILLAQADAGTVPVERRLVDLDALVSTVAKDCEVLAVDRVSLCRSRAPPDRPVWTPQCSASPSRTFCTTLFDIVLHPVKSPSARLAQTPRGSSRCRTTARASPRHTTRISSSGSIASIRDARARLGASAWGWPWRAGASKRTAVESRLTAMPAPDRDSGLFCLETRKPVNLNV